MSVSQLLILSILYHLLAFTFRGWLSVPRCGLDAGAVLWRGDVASRRPEPGAMYRSHPRCAAACSAWSRRMVLSAERGRFHSASAAFQNPGRCFSFPPVGTDGKGREGETSFPHAGRWLPGAAPAARPHLRGRGGRRAPARRGPRRLRAEGRGLR